MTAAQKNPPVIESVRLAPDETALFVSLVDTDPEVLAFAKAGGLGDDAVGATKRALRLGIVAGSIGSAQSTVGELYRVAEQIQALERLPETVALRLSDAIGAQLQRVVGDDERPGALAAALDSVTTESAKTLSVAIKPIQEALLGSGPAALPQLLETRLTQSLTRESKAILARIFDVDSGSPLMTHLAAGEKAIAALRADTVALEERVRGQIGELTQAVLVQRADRPSAVNAGNDWEADSLDDIAAVTAILGDTVEPVGATTGHGGSKAGDGVLHVCDESVEGMKVAIECRTGASRRCTVDQLRQMVTNRDAHAGLLLAKTAEALPRDAQAAGFRVYFGERLVVMHYDRADPAASQQLAVAVQVSRVLARLSATSGGSLAERDEIRSGVSRIESALSHLRPLRAAVTGIEKETGRVQSHASALEADIRRALADMTALIAA